MLIYFVRRRKDLPFSHIFWLFGAFILGCGFTHFMEVIVTYTPVYYLSGVVKLFTAVVSLATVAALVPITPRALAWRSPQELEREVAARKQAESGLLTANAELERRVEERTAALRESEERLRLAVESADIGTWDYNPSTGGLKWSARCKAIFGLSPDADMNYDIFLSRLHPEDRERTHQAAQATLDPKGNGAFDMDYRSVWPDGAVRWVIAKGQAFFEGEAEARRAIRFTGTVLDVTDRKRLENEVRERAEKLAEAEERIRSVVNHVIDGIITIDGDGTVESMNPAAERLFGFGAAEVVGQNVKVLMPEPYHGEHDAYLANYLRTGQAKIIGVGREVLGRRKDGSTFPMDLAVSEFWLGKRRYFTGIVRDVTERKRLEQELRNRVEQLAEADLRKNEFLAILAHELRNPLAPIKNALEVMRLAGDDARAVEQARQMCERQVKHVARLVDDLLDVSRISRGKIELRKGRVELAAVVQNAVETSRPLIKESGQELTVELPLEPVYLEADLTRLAQVVANLLNNSAKYTPQGGRIRLTAERHGGKVVVKVTDNGIGIPADMLPHVFEMFTQVDRSLERTQGGLGIGLTLVKRLAELHGGSVEAHSDGPGKGSEFAVCLPVAGETSVRKPAPPSVDGEQKPVATRRLLVVDDLQDSADSLAAMLQLMGHEVQTAYDGEQAVEAARTFRPEVVLLDLGMPKLNGYDTCRRIRELAWGKGVFLIALTGWGQDEDRRRTREAGFNAHLVKPVDPAGLMKLLAGLQPAPGNA